MNNVTDCVVVGRGRAGRARTRVITEHSSFSLLDHISGRSFFEVSDREGALFFICTENAQHFSIAQSLLIEGKDVVLEFPPCTTQREWRSLCRLSEENNSLLHCALIGLYTQVHQERRRWCASNIVHTLHVSFTGGFYRWVEEEAQKGHTVQLAFGRLSAIWDLCGPLEFLESSVQYEKEGYCLRLYAKGKRGEDIFLEERRTVGGARGTVWEISSNQGAVFTAPPRKREDLFAMDLRRMYERIPCDVEIDAICGFIDTAHHSMVEVI